MWLRTKGKNPKDAGVKAELERVRTGIQDKAKRNPVDAQAAKRLVKGSLWQPKRPASENHNEKPSKHGRFA